MLRDKNELFSGFVDESSKDYRVLSYPDLQAWIPLMYKDGTSPGWLHITSKKKQITTVGVRC